MSLKLKMTAAEASAAMVTAMQNQDANAFAEAMQAYGDAIAADLRADYEALRNETDTRVLQARGIRQLTAKETKFYENFKTYAKAKLDNVTAGLTNTDIVMPETIIDQIFDDVTIGHPLLAHINFQNTSYATKWIRSKNPFQKAVWGKITDAVTKEIASDFAEEDMTKMQLTAFIPVSRGILDLGPSWIDRYVRTILAEAIANGLEDGAINNLKTSTGPVGMMADLTTGAADASDASIITYTAKTAEAVTDLSPETYGNLLAKLAKTANGNARPVNSVVMIVNPVDYLKKIFPAITVQGVNGNYVQNTLAFPTTFVQSAAVSEGKAILYLDKGYWMGLGQSGNAGTIEYSDQYKFLEKNRYYMIYLYADGKPSDNNVTVVLDITGLKPAAIATTVKGTVTTKAEATQS